MEFRHPETDLFVCPLITHDADSLDREQHSERLTNLVVQTGLANLRDVDVICLLENLDLLAGDWSENANREARSREWMALDKMGRNVKKTTKSADFV